MNRRLFIATLLPAGIASSLIANDTGKQKSWSGRINDVDASKMTIHMHTKHEPNVVRNVVYDDSTKVTLDGKPAKVHDAQNGYRIRALGEYEGNDLKAKEIVLSRGGLLANR